VDYTLVGGTLVTYGRKSERGRLGIRGERIAAGQGKPTFDLGGKSTVYPALVNSHDHLLGNYLPAIGPGNDSFYLTWMPWDNDLKTSAVFRERSVLSREELYLLSAYKCLFSGVATVNDHFPHDLNRHILPTLPIRAIPEYCLAHECSSYDLGWGAGMVREHDLAVEKGWPFVTHICEGFDDESMRGIDILESAGCLSRNCLLVHCLSVSDGDIGKMARAGASVAWCPRSNMRMFNVTAKVRKMLQAEVNVTLGTDSSASGSINLLEEIRYGRDLYRQLYGEDLPARRLFEMVTVNAARALWMEDRIGTLEIGKLADILVLETKDDDPYENLVNAGMADIELLVLAGRPIYGQTRFLDIFGGRLPAGYSLVEVGGRRMFVKGNPAGLYLNLRKKVGFDKVLDYLPFEP